VRWDPPAQALNPLKLRLAPTDHPSAWSLVTLSPTSYHATVRGLDPARAYHLEVYAGVDFASVVGKAHLPAALAGKDGPAEVRWRVGAGGAGVSIGLERGMIVRVLTGLL
jgi:hypothetical protein